MKDGRLIEKLRMVRRLLPLIAFNRPADLVTFEGGFRGAVPRKGDGHFIYASVRSTDVIAGFSIDPRSGNLSPIGFFAAEGSPRGFSLEPLGRFLICAGQSQNTVAVYAINPKNGALEHVPFRWNRDMLQIS
jgi:6-phosphogluconolactonase (cycloisomerase 2 family)